MTFWTVFDVALPTLLTLAIALHFFNLWRGDK